LKPRLPKRASYSRKAFAQYMSIDLGGFYALVAKQLLYRADVRALSSDIRK